MQTILHEMHHAFVHYTVENIDYESKLVQDNYYYKQAREWKENTVNYISSSSNYDEYMNYLNSDEDSLDGNIDYDEKDE